MSDISHPSRRSFLRSAVVSAVVSPALAGFAQSPHEKESAAAAIGGDATLVGRITLDREVASHDGVLNGTLRFLRLVSGSAEVQWIDSFGRLSGVQKIPLSGASAPVVSFTFNMRAGLTYVNWIRVSVNGVMQAAGAKFMLSPAWTPWDDFHTISWAHYPDGYYNQLRAAGLDSIIAYTKENHDAVIDNNFRFYVEQMAWEVFSIYHKDQPEWRTLLTMVSQDRGNLQLWARTPCLNDPKTTEYLRENLTRYVHAHRDFRPLFYNIADELGQADQIRPNDFCHSPFCTSKFAEYLRKEYKEPSGAAREWNVGHEMTHWDDARLQAVPDWDKTGSMMAWTTTDSAFESIALAGIMNRYGTIANFNREWGTSFPVPAGNAAPMRDSWNPILAVARESLSAPVLDGVTLAKVMGPLPQANARWGGLGSWNAPDAPTSFANWDQVGAFVTRFFKELGEITSTRGWNVSAWCDFRNFMDATFADAVRAAGAICKAEDPHALCGTEGGQSPSAYGWYNYEQVVHAVDVIEPYNIGNNVEVIRSLNPATIMISTHGFGGFDLKPGQQPTEEQRAEQNRAIRPIWWGLFHSHYAALIWDNNEPATKFVDLSTGTLTTSAETFSAIFHELRGGIGKLFINSKRKHDGIAIHYSQASIQLHWLLDNVRYAREWMLKSGGTSDSLCIAVRNSWTKLIEDLGLQYNFVGRRQIEAGDLGSGEYKVFIMPESLAVSEEEAEQLRAFVAAGGTVIADCRAADLNARGRDLGRGLLDDVFGIGHGPARPAAGPVQGIGGEGTLRLGGRHLSELRAADPAVTAAAGKPLARCGDIPLVIVNHFGAGRAVYLNLELADYAYLRLRPDSTSSLPELIEGILELADVRPPVRVVGEDGERVRGIEVVRFANGDCEQVAIFRNPQFDDGGWGAYPKLLADNSGPVLDPALGHIDNSLLEKEAAVTVEWPEDGYTWDIRARKALGQIRKQSATLSPWEPLVYARASQSISALRVSVAAARAGEMVEVSLEDEGAAPEGAFRVVHLEFETPSGMRYELYARNAMVRKAPHVERIPFAVNDAKGRWKLIAHDLITGQQIETPFSVT